MDKELKIKLESIQSMLAKRNLEALLIQRVSTFAWATNGAASYIDTAVDLGVGFLLITPTGRYLITNNIEATRFRDEEGLEEQGWEFIIAPWQEDNPALAELTKGLKLASDSYYPGAVDVSADLLPLRTNLLPGEQTRYADLSQGCAQAMNAAIRQVKPGQSEYEIAALLSAETQKRGILPIVNLIATDGRIFRHRHPLPTAKQMDKYAMLVLCGRKYGLVCSLTRLVHFGPLPDEIKRKAEAVAEVDATFIYETQPGVKLNEILAKAQKKYAQTGYPDEWRLHHQGGPASYSPRETIATPTNEFVVTAGQVHAWNPSITGTKSEDTILIKEDGFEILSEIEGWPTVPVRIKDKVIPRPGILVVT